MVSALPHLDECNRLESLLGGDWPIDLVDVEEGIRFIDMRWRRPVCFWARKRRVYERLTYHDIEEAFNDVLVMVWKHRCLELRRVNSMPSFLFASMKFACNYILRNWTARKRGGGGESGGEAVSQRYLTYEDMHKLLVPECDHCDAVLIAIHTRLNPEQRSEMEAVERVIEEWGTFSYVLAAQSWGCTKSQVEWRITKLRQSCRFANTKGLRQALSSPPVESIGRVGSALDVVA